MSYGSYHETDELDVSKLESSSRIGLHINSLRSSSSSDSLGRTSLESNGFGLAIASSTEDVQNWLRENEFPAEVLTTLSGYTGQDLMELSKDDCKDLLGAFQSRCHPSFIELLRRSQWNSIVQSTPCL